jgi:hypothetical protein
MHFPTPLILFAFCGVLRLRRALGIMASIHSDVPECSCAFVLTSIHPSEVSPIHPTLGTQHVSRLCAKACFRAMFVSCGPGSFGECLHVCVTAWSGLSLVSVRHDEVIVLD